MDQGQNTSPLHITRRFDLEPLAGVREKAGDLSAALEFGR
jgi:hypothetical protein